jgi:hypothetical protein
MLARIWLLMLVAAGVSFAGTTDVKTSTDSTTAKTDTATTVKNGSLAVKDVVFASYFHGDVRCPTCMKLEAYSGEAILAGFDKEVKDSLVVFRTVNWDREENAHFVDDYQLFTKALILSRVRGGKEIAWANLDSIWQYVGDKDKFVKYVQSHARAFVDKPVK